MTGLELQSIEAAEAAMTPAPWRFVQDVKNPRCYQVEPSVCSVQYAGNNVPMYSNDACSVVRLRNAVPQLIAEIKRLRTEAAQLESRTARAEAQNREAAQKVALLWIENERLVNGLKHLPDMERRLAVAQAEAESFRNALTAREQAIAALRLWQKVARPRSLVEKELHTAATAMVEQEQKI